MAIIVTHCEYCALLVALIELSALLWVLPKLGESKWRWVCIMEGLILSLSEMLLLTTCVKGGREKGLDEQKRRIDTVPKVD